VQEVVICDAERSDAEAIAAVHVRAWATAYRGLMADDVLAAMTPERRAAAWSERLADPSLGPTIVAADGGGTIIGFCALATPTRDEGEAVDTAEVTALYVDPPSWRAGVGSGCSRRRSSASVPKRSQRSSSGCSSATRRRVRSTSVTGSPRTAPSSTTTLPARAHRAVCAPSACG
jgi:GNAT superfamily N-acetyltransferase